MSTPLADPADMDMVVTPASISKILTETRKKFLLAASDEAYAELVRVGCTLPLSSWSADIRHKVATIGTYEACSSLGFDIAAQGNSLLLRANAARAWFKALTVKPPGVVDATPTVEESGRAHVVTSTKRGW